MRHFKASEYTAIAIANHYGLDRKTWDFRLNWFNSNKAAILNGQIGDAKEPILMDKAIRAYKDIQAKRCLLLQELLGHFKLWC